MIRVLTESFSRRQDIERFMGNRQARHFFLRDLDFRQRPLTKGTRYICEKLLGWYAEYTVDKYFSG